MGSAHRVRREIPNVATLHRLADAARNAGEKLPVLFAAVQLSGQPAVVADYLAPIPHTGLQDLGASLRYGSGGVQEVVLRQQRFYDSNLERQVTAFNPLGRFFDFAANLAFQNPRAALMDKWFLYLLSGFFLAAAMHFAVPPLDVRSKCAGFTEDDVLKEPDLLRIAFTDAPAQLGSDVGGNVETAAERAVVPGRAAAFPFPDRRRGPG